MSDLSIYKIHNSKSSYYLPEMIILPSNSPKNSTHILPPLSSFIRDLGLCGSFKRRFTVDTSLEYNYHTSPPQINLYNAARRYSTIPKTESKDSYNISDLELSPKAFDHLPIKPKRKRAGKEQIQILNEIFKNNPFPSTELRIKLAAKLRMSPRAIQIWFQNKRQTQKN